MRTPARVLATLLWLPALGAGCRRQAIDLENRPCGSSADCAPSYQCNVATGVCVRPTATDCAGGGFCPRTNDPCDTPGALSFCADGATSCREGCRACDGRVWSECTTADCVIGVPERCGRCDEDCRTVAANVRTPLCVRTGASFACDYDSCDAGYVDDDNWRYNGCECAIRCIGRCGGPDGCGGTCPPRDCAAELGANYYCSPPAWVCRCDGEDDPTFCANHGAECGSVTAVDRCNVERTVASCGDCTGQGLRHPYCRVLDGMPRQCADWWDCDYAYSAPLTITAGDEIPAGYAVMLELDHAQLVRDGLSASSGDDLRVVAESGAGWTELDRVADPEPGWGWNSAKTRIWFKAPAAVPSRGSLRTVHLFYGNSRPNAPAPPADERKVFWFADFFDRADGTDVDPPGTPANQGWNERYCGTSENKTCDAAIAGGGLRFATDDTGRRPLVTHAFAPLQGRIAWRFASSWTWRSSNIDYYVLMHLGQRFDVNLAAASSLPPFTGQAAAFAWHYYSSGTSTKHGLYSVRQRSSNGVDWIPSTVQSVDPSPVRAVFEAVLDTAAKKLEATVNDFAWSDLVFRDNQVTAVDSVRFMAHQVAGEDTSIYGRTFDYVLVRQARVQEPVVTRGAQEVRPACAP